MRIHPRLASLLFSIVFFPLYLLVRKLLKLNIAFDIIAILSDAIISTIIYHHLVKKYDDEDMII